MGYPFWMNYPIGTRSFKTQYGFVQSVKAIRIKFDLPSYNTQELEGLLIPLEMKQTEINFNLRTNLYNKDTCTDVLKCYALETIDMKYPVSEFMYVYTDGFLLDDYMTEGSGVFSILFSIYAFAGNYRTAFEGEVIAIRIALTLSRVVMAQQHHMFNIE